MASNSSQAALNKKAAVTQSLLLILMAAFWVPFLFSAWSYQQYNWFPYLLISRWTLFLVPILTIPIVLYRHRPFPGFEFHYYLVAMAIQASHGYLEPSTQLDFYSYTSLFLLLSSLGYPGTFRRWFVRYLPFILAVHVVPLFVKDPKFFTSFGVFVDKFTFNVALATLSVVIVRISAKKFIALEENVLLHAALLAEKQQRLTLVEDELGKARAAIEASARLVAIGQMSQMLAHDVRKPFSLLKMGLNMLNKAPDLGGVKQVLGKLTPELLKAISHVDGMLADVMEVGSTATELIKEPVTPEILIENTLAEIFRIYPKSQIDITYDLRHTQAVNVHVQKVGRVFSNIVGNAVQAMGQAVGFGLRRVNMMGPLSSAWGTRGL